MICYPFPIQALVFTCLQYKSFENTVGKEEIARNEKFLLFSQCFPSYLEIFVPFSLNLELPSANSFNLEESKICCWGKGFLSFDYDKRDLISQVIRFFFFYHEV